MRSQTIEFENAKKVYRGNLATSSDAVVSPLKETQEAENDVLSQ